MALTEEMARQIADLKAQDSELNIRCDTLVSLRDQISAKIDILTEQHYEYQRLINQIYREAAGEVK
jgi:uncharacterized coiled-coil DUF342 family protein